MFAPRIETTARPPPIGGSGVGATEKRPQHSEAPAQRPPRTPLCSSSAQLVRHAAGARTRLSDTARLKRGSGAARAQLGGRVWPTCFPEHRRGICARLRANVAGSNFAERCHCRICRLCRGNERVHRLSVLWSSSGSPSRSATTRRSTRGISATSTSARGCRPRVADERARAGGEGVRRRNGCEGAAGAALWRPGFSHSRLPTSQVEPWAVSPEAIGRRRRKIEGVCHAARAANAEPDTSEELPASR